jgi:hypothetical protein
VVWRLGCPIILIRPEGWLKTEWMVSRQKRSSKICEWQLARKRLYYFLAHPSFLAKPSFPGPDGSLSPISHLEIVVDI